MADSGPPGPVQSPSQPIPAQSAPIVTPASTAAAPPTAATPSSPHQEAAAPSSPHQELAALPTADQEAAVPPEGDQEGINLPPDQPDPGPVHDAPEQDEERPPGSRSQSPLPGALYLHGENDPHPPCLNNVWCSLRAATYNTVWWSREYIRLSNQTGTGGSVENLLLDNGIDPRARASLAITASHPHPVPASYTFPQSNPAPVTLFNFAQPPLASSSSQQHPPAPFPQQPLASSSRSQHPASSFPQQPLASSSRAQNPHPPSSLPQHPLVPTSRSPEVPIITRDDDSDSDPHTLVPKWRYAGVGPNNEPRCRHCGTTTQPKNQSWRYWEKRRELRLCSKCHARYTRRVERGYADGEDEQEQAEGPTVTPEAGPSTQPLPPTTRATRSRRSASKPATGGVVADSEPDEEGAREGEGRVTRRTGGSKGVAAAGGGGTEKEKGAGKGKTKRVATDEEEEEGGEVEEEDEPARKKARGEPKQKETEHRASTTPKGQGVKDFYEGDDDDEDPLSSPSKRSPSKRGSRSA
ncbi:hypothetical protein CF319_g8260 [Tilletia indica]|nr:hypothetical protein CF319_g8260 [Tilletia indica]